MKIYNVKKENKNKEVFKVVLYIITSIFLLFLLIKYYQFIKERDEKLINRYEKCIEYTNLLYSSNTYIDKNKIQNWIENNCYIPR